MSKNSGILAMVFSVLAIVLGASMFETIFSGLATLRSTSGVSDFLVLQTVIGIAPTIILLLLLGGGVWGYWKGYSTAAATDASGLVRIVFGALMVIVFVSMFSSILSPLHAVWNNAGNNGTVDNTTVWIALRTVSSIMPTILFLSGVFAGVSTTIGGIRSRRRSKAMV